MDLMELRKDYIAKHREMWNWLAENPDKEKMHWPGWKNNKRVSNNCFLCGYSDATGHRDVCNCPLDWLRTKFCMERDPKLSYYLLYDEATTLKDRAKYAKIIANLPEKDNMQDELIIEEACRRC